MSAEERYERLQELLIQRASEGCSDQELDEIATLLREFPDVVEDDWELLAARVDLELQGLGAPGATEGLDALPETLRAKVVREAPIPPIESTSASRVSVFPWLAAAAALLAALYFAFPTPDAPPDFVGARSALLEDRADVVNLTWKGTEDAAAAGGVGGDVVWSHAAQRGYMRFSSLAANDPDVEQYQLWIFDETRPEATPVDGGVFDVPSEGEVVVPIRAALNVGKAHLFAVTVEKAGGVVVSDRSRIAVLASVPE